MTPGELQLLTALQKGHRSAMNLAKLAFGLAATALTLAGYCIGH
ncbi:MAG TPA: hypothetical protein VM286_05855 [Candidatus Thermoplasmatota archaeon]|nr:hypothetical protein [Candidatus Thermoplasmatota archaeon]